MLDSCENSRTDLCSAALEYQNLGWSVIPIRGDSDLQNPKAAAVQWSKYQQRIPPSGEVESWFGDGRFLGLGIVCGRVSGLTVLDIDDPQWREPIQRFHATGVPHLTLLDSDHSVAESWTGKVPQSLLLDRIESILT